METTVIVRVVLHLGKSPHPAGFICEEGLVTRMRMPALSNPPCFPGKSKSGRHPELWPQASSLLVGVGRTHFKGWKLRHPDGFPFGSRWKLCGFRTKSLVFACRKLRDQLSNVIQAGGEALKDKKAHYTWCIRQRCWLRHSVLNEVVTQHRWEHWSRTAVMTADYTSSTLWDITATKNRRKVLCFLKKHLWLFGDGGWNKMQAMVSGT